MDFEGTQIYFLFSQSIGIQYFFKKSGNQGIFDTCCMEF